MKNEHWWDNQDNKYDSKLDIECILSPFDTTLYNISCLFFFGR